MTSPELTTETTETGPVTTIEDGDAGQSTGGINPAWEPVLTLLPERIHEPVMEHFRKWDDNYRSLETKYKELEANAKPVEASPYDEFNGIDPGQIRAALQIADTINSDPRRVAEIMAESLGLTLAEAQAAVEEAQNQAPLEFDDEDDPRLKQLYELTQQQQRELQEYQERQENFFQQQVREQQEAQRRQEEVRLDRQVTAELNEVLSKDPVLKAQIEAQNPAGQQFLDQMFLMAGHLATQGDKTPLATAYARLNNWANSIKQSVAPKNTPLFVPTGGQAPPAQESSNKSTRDRALEMLEALHSEGQG